MRRPPQAQRQILAIALIALGTLTLLANLHIIGPAGLSACSPLIADHPPKHLEVQ